MPREKKSAVGGRGKKSGGSAAPGRSRKTKPAPEAKNYVHPEAESLLRPDVGTQAQFRKKKPPTTYRYDSSLSPSLDWDGKNPAREVGEWLLAAIHEAAALPSPHQFPSPRQLVGSDGTVRASVSSLDDAVQQLARLGKPFLNWAGKAERLSFDVPALPLFVHERLSTVGILETLKGHKRDKQLTMFDLFGDPEHPIGDQVLRAYEHKGNWTNRMILGDSLVVMNSLLRYEHLGGQVQMIYMDPPYGVKFGSNFQPFVRKRDVKHNDDEDMTREPEMVKAYRDTWELGLHSYLTYMRDRLLLARELLSPSGSIFVQISDENVHRVRDLMDEVFGEGNLVCVVTVQKAPYATATTLPVVSDFLCWYARDKSRLKYRQLFKPKADLDSLELYRLALSPDRRTYRPLSRDEMEMGSLPDGWRRYRLVSLVSQGASKAATPFVFNGREYNPPGNAHWKVTVGGLERVAEAGRIQATANSIQFRSFIEDFPVSIRHNLWTDTITGSFLDEKLYVVQTNPKIVERCLLMTTDPGDLVLDPTCGSGTTAYVAEQWGRRWITIDTSRVPLALARQRLLTATFPYYELNDSTRGPGGGFTYKRKQNSKGEEVGGIVPHVTLKSIANDEPPAEEILVDRPEKDEKVTRVTGPFTVEATVPTPVDWDADGVPDAVGEKPEEYGDFVNRLLEILRKSPVLQLGGGRAITLKNVRPPARTMSLSAEALVDDGDEKPVAFVFGPENGAVSEKLVYEAAREAHLKTYTHLYVIGFAIQPNARALVDQCHAAVGVPATYVQATPDIMMGDLLKSVRSSQIFSVCGLPEITVHTVKPKEKGEPVQYQVELIGLDVFDPTTMETDHRSGNDVPAWFLDTDYNGLCFHVCQAFFPRTGAWESIKKALKTEYEDSVWEHLAGTTSAQFEAGTHGQIAVKVIDDRGNELLVTHTLRSVR